MYLYLMCLINKGTRINIAAFFYLFILTCNCVNMLLKASKEKKDQKGGTEKNQRNTRYSSTAVPAASVGTYELSLNQRAWILLMEQQKQHNAQGKPQTLRQGWVFCTWPTWSYTLLQPECYHTPYTRLSQGIICAGRTDLGSQQIKSTCEDNKS